MASPFNRAERPRLRQGGLTLVELLVTVAILVVLVAQSAQLGIQWINNSKVTQAQATLQQAYSQAKATALQNYLGKINGEPAAMLCFSTSGLQVYAGGTCTGKVALERPLPNGVSIQFGSGPLRSTPICLALTNAGVPVANADSLTCGTSLTYSITAGSVNVTDKNLY